VLTSRRLAILLVLAAAPAWATTYPVGSTRTYGSPCLLVASVALQPGDIVEVDPGTYTDACKLTASGTAANPIILRGLPGPRPVFDATGLDLSGSGPVPRAIFQFTGPGGSHWRVSHLELKNAQNGSANGAAFRVTADALDIVIDDVSVHDCQDGFMSDGAATLTVRSSDVFHNGAGDGFSHNFYVQGQSIVLIGNHIHDSKNGQNVKVRSHDALIAYNLIENAGNYEIDLIQNPPQTDAPNANAILIGNLIVRPASADNNSQVILWGTDNAADTGRNGSLYAFSNTFILANPSNRLFHAISPAAGSQIHLVNSIVHATVSGTGLATDATTAGILVGSNDWISSNVTSAGSLTSVLTGTAPGFVSSTDLHLTAASPVLGAGLSGVTGVDGTGATVTGIPDQEYSVALGTTARAAGSSLDLGAYGFPRASDGGTPDAGVPDGGTPDAGAGTDAGGDPSGSGPTGPGEIVGSCSSAPGGIPLLALAALVALLGRRRSVNSRS
jgi:MYXO-CTERM domain-containing protein